MKKIIFCKFYKKKLPGLEKKTYFGKIGKKIFNNISKKAWKKWLLKQTILINENKLNMFNKNDKKKIKKYMKNFLFKNKK